MKSQNLHNSIIYLLHKFYINGITLKSVMADTYPYDSRALSYYVNHVSFIGELDRFLCKTKCDRCVECPRRYCIIEDTDYNFITLEYKYKDEMSIAYNILLDDLNNITKFFYTSVHCRGGIHYRQCRLLTIEDIKRDIESITKE